MKSIYYYPVSIGTIGIVEQDGAITGAYFQGETVPADAEMGETPLLREAGQQLSEYLAGTRKQFSLLLAPAGTDFQRVVWNALIAIPCGETRTYAQIAQQIGSPKAARAVGLANNRNPIPIFIPCHRVIGADGGLAGYAGGLELKRFLLALEQGQLSLI